MTVETTHSKNTFTGNGSQTVYAFTFRVYLTTEVVVLVDNAVQSPTVALDSSGVGGTVTFSSPPALDSEIIIKRAVEQKQPATFPLRAKLDTGELEELLDRMVCMTQDNTRDLLSNTFNWRGTWSSAETYQIGDAVYWAGTTYRALSEHSNHEPPNATYWAVVAAKGDSGGLTWQGSWDSGTSYAVGDGVTNDGSSYICIASSTNNEPPNATYWEVLAEAGVDGAMSGPVSSTDNAIALFNGTSGNIVKDSGITVPATGGKALFPVRVNSGASGLEYHDQSASELTIASGAIVPTGNWHTVDNESDASADDLTDITATNLPAGALLYLTAENSGRVPTVKHNASKIDLWDDTDVDLAVDNVLILVHQGSNVWRQIGLVSNGASGGVGSPIGAALAPMTVATLYTQAHELGYVPKDYYMLATCTTADLGYSVGETIRIPSVTVNWHPTVGPYHYGLVMSADATNLYVKTAATYSPMILNKSTGGVSNMTLGSWSFQRYLVG